MFVENIGRRENQFGRLQVAVKIADSVNFEDAIRRINRWWTIDEYSYGIRWIHIYAADDAEVQEIFRSIRRMKFKENN